MARPVFVAPHYDDVALSCGGYVARVARTTSPLIVTVFGGEPETAEGAFVRSQHEGWGLEDADVISARRAEDACAASALGAHVTTRWFDYLDAIYRNPAYNSDRTLMGEVHPADESLPTAIAADLAKLDATEIYVPLTIGNHVDHQLVLRAGLLLAGQGMEVWAYPDIPYAFRYTIDQIGRKLRGALQRLEPLDDDAFARKVQAVECYRSQLPVLFRNYGPPADELRRFAVRSGNGTPVETFYAVIAGQPVTKSRRPERRDPLPQRPSNAGRQHPGQQ